MLSIIRQVGVIEQVSDRSPFFLILCQHSTQEGDKRGVLCLAEDRVIDLFALDWVHKLEETLDLEGMALRRDLEKGNTSCPDVLALSMLDLSVGNCLRRRVVVRAGSVEDLVVWAVIEALARTEVVQYQVLIWAFQLAVFRLDVPMGHLFLHVAQMEGWKELARPFPYVFLGWSFFQLVQTFAF